MLHIYANHFVFDIIFWCSCFASDQVTWPPLQPVLSRGSEHQGQMSISDPDQNSGFTCTGKSVVGELAEVMQEINQTN